MGKRSVNARIRRNQRLAEKRKSRRRLLREAGLMPPRKREVRSFPAKYLEIVAQAANGKLPPPMQVQDKRAAKAVQLDFNRFRGALLDENNPLYEVARNLIVRITNREGRAGFAGDYIVEFVTRELYNRAEELKGRRPLPPLPQGTDDNGLPIFAPEPAAPGIDLEKLIEQWTGIKPKQEDRVTTDCTHEPDITGTHCIKCNKPLA